jgi:hypothetical protein
MALEIISISKIVKEKLKKTWKFIIKYWQFFLGLSVGFLIFVVKKDRTEISNTFKKFKSTSDEMVERSLEIEDQEMNKIDDAINDFHENINEAKSEFDDRDAEIDSRRDKIKEELLDRENNERGTIADEIKKEIS